RARVAEDLGWGASGRGAKARRDATFGSPSFEAESPGGASRARDAQVGVSAAPESVRVSDGLFGHRRGDATRAGAVSRAAFFRAVGSLAHGGRSERQAGFVRGST